MKRIVYVIAVLGLGSGLSACGSTPDSPSPAAPAPVKFTAALSPGNEVPPVTNADAGASGTATITFNLTRDAAGAILSGTVDFSVSLTGFPSGSALTAAHHPPGGAGVNGGVLISTTIASGEVTFPAGSGTLTKTGIALTATRPMRSWRIRPAITSTFTPPTTREERRADSSSGSSHGHRRTAPPIVPLGSNPGAHLRDRRLVGPPPGGGDHRPVACPGCGPPGARSRDGSVTAGVFRLPFERDALAVVLAHSPASWLVLRDVERGRGQVNFSQWGRYNPFDQADILDRACALASKRKMPLWPYRLLHAEARLGDAEIGIICDWSRAEAARLVNGGM